MPVPLEVGPSAVVAVEDLHIDVWLYEHAEEGVLLYYAETVALFPGSDTFHFFFQPQDDICATCNCCITNLAPFVRPVVREVLVLKVQAQGATVNIEEQNRGLVEYLMHK